jgi:hypothetical protein
MTESVTSLALATFTPSETENITGVSQATQRDWRRRELTSFATRKGRKRFTTDDLAHLVVLNQLIPQVRPAVAYQLARMSCSGATKLLAEQFYPRAKIKIDGYELDPSDVNRFAVYCRFVDGQQVTYFKTSDLNSLPKKSRKSGKYPVAFYVIVDLTEIAVQLRNKRIKPYFVRVEQKE